MKKIVLILSIILIGSCQLLFAESWDGWEAFESSSRGLESGAEVAQKARQLDEKTLKDAALPKDTATTTVASSETTTSAAADTSTSTAADTSTSAAADTSSSASSSAANETVSSSNDALTATADANTAVTNVEPADATPGSSGTDTAVSKQKGARDTGD